MKRVLIIVDHGSRLAEANAMVARTASEVQTVVGAGWLVQHAHMELAQPSLAGAIDAAVAGGARHVVVQPLFLALGKHASIDIPAIVESARQRHSEVLFLVAEVLGPDPLLSALVIKRARLE